MRATDSGLVSALVLVELSAAFDTVDHRILLDLLSFRFAVTDRAYEWFSSYLTGRTQVISTNTSTSEAVALTCGVPQDSVVGQQQFTAYTEDVEELIESFEVKDHLYADDTQVLNVCVFAKFNVVNQISRDVYSQIDAPRSDFSLTSIKLR